MEAKCIAAYTEPNDWPAFINISRLEDGNVLILVRDRGNEKTGASLNMIEIKMSHEEFREFYNEIVGHMP